MTEEVAKQGTVVPANDASKGAEKVEEVDLRNLQDKFHNLLDQRNSYNDMARELREARDLLNATRRERSGELHEHKAARDAVNEKTQAERQLRNAFQDQAKALIAQKKGQKGALESSLPLQVRKLRNEIAAASARQETTVLTIEKERDLVDNLRKQRVELTKLEAQLDKQKALVVNLDDTDQAIDELFKKADESHEKVVALQNEANEHHDKFVATIKELRVLQKEADEKHHEFIAIRKKADEQHQKAMELREKVMSVKGERKAEWAARRKEIQDVNKAARTAVNDPKAIQKANDEALDALKSGGKISLGF